MDVLLTDICARALIFLAEDGGYRVYQSDMHDLPDVLVDSSGSWPKEALNGRWRASRRCSQDAGCCPIFLPSMI
jgi:hypothetical protein